MTRVQFLKMAVPADYSQAIALAEIEAGPGATQEDLECHKKFQIDTLYWEIYAQPPNWLIKGQGGGSKERPTIEATRLRLEHAANLKRRKRQPGPRAKLALLSPREREERRKELRRNKPSRVARRTGYRADSARKKQARAKVPASRRTEIARMGAAARAAKRSTSNE